MHRDCTTVPRSSTLSPPSSARDRRRVRSSKHHSRSRPYERRASMDEQPARKRSRGEHSAPHTAAAAPALSTVAGAATAAVNSLAAQQQPHHSDQPRSILAHMQQQSSSVVPCTACPPMRAALARSSELVAELQSQLTAQRSQFAAAQRQIWALQMAAKSCFVQDISDEPLRLVGGMRGAGEHSSHASSSGQSHGHEHTHSGRAKMRRTAVSRRSSDNDDDDGADDAGGAAAAAAMPPSLPPLAAAAASSTSSSSSSSGCGSTPSPTPALPACRFCSAPGVYSMRHRSCDGREEELACYCASHESMVTRMLSQWQSQAWNGVDAKTKADCDSCWSSEQLERMLPPKTDEELRAEAILTQRCHAFTSSGGCRADWIAEDALVHSRRLIGLSSDRCTPSSFDKSPAFAGSSAPPSSWYGSTEDPGSAVAGGMSGRICAREDCCTRVDPNDDASVGDSDSHSHGAGAGGLGPRSNGSNCSRSLRSNLSVVSATIDLHELLMVERSSVAESCARSLCEVDRRRHDRLFFFCHAHWLIVARLLAHSHPERGPIQLRPHPRIKQRVFTLDQFLATPDDEPARVHQLEHLPQQQQQQQHEHLHGKSKKKNKRSRSSVDEENNAAVTAAAATSASAAATPSPALSSLSVSAAVTSAL